LHFFQNADLIGKNGVYIWNQRPQIYKWHLFLFLNFFMTRNLLDSESNTFALEQPREVREHSYQEKNLAC